MQSYPKNKLVPLYFLSSDETLLLEEARDTLILHAKAQGFSTRHIININSSNDWLDFINSTQSIDLFNDKKIIDVRNPAAKFDAKAQEAIAHYTSLSQPDLLVIISCGKLTGAQKKTKWFQAIEQQASVNIIWPIKKHELPKWISQRLKQHELIASPEIIQLLIELTEGNLLATSQALEKLSLLFPKQPINATQITALIHDNSEFNVFDLSNDILAGKTNRVLHIMENIQHKNSESTLVLWALTRDIRLLYTLRSLKEHHQPLIALLSKEWDPRKTLLQHAIQKLPLNTLSHLLTQCHEADLAIKGVHAGNAWHHLTDIALTLSQSISS